MHLLIFVYVLSIGFHTIFNYTGTTPVSLVSAMILACLLFSKLLHGGLKTPKLSTLDVLMLCFLLVSILSTFISILRSTDLNLNHLYAHFSVILLYYFSVRWAIYNSPYSNAPQKFLTVLYVLFILMVSILFIDYFLLVQGVNIADLLPMEKANKIAGTGVTSRPRGFFVEPTDLGLALNVIGPVVLVYLYLTKKFTSFIVILLLFLAGHILVRSAAAFVGLAIGVSVAGIDMFLKHRIRIRTVVKRTSLTQMLILFIILLVVFFTFKGIIIDNLASVFSKVFFAENSGSANGRYNAWSNTLSLFMNSNNPLMGNGTGYLSVNHDSSHSWFLSVLVENGIIGFLILLLIVTIGLIKIFKIQSKIRYGLYVSLLSVTVHLATQTGFYFPFFWLVLVLIQYNWHAAKVTPLVYLERIKPACRYASRK